MRLTRAQLVETMAEAGWQADAIRATGRKRLVPWSEAGEPDQEKWRSIARAMLAAGFEPVAKWCDQNIMGVGGNRKTTLAGYVIEPNRDETGKHPGNGYAAFIRTLTTKGKTNV